MDAVFEKLLIRADALTTFGRSRFEALTAVGLGHHFLALPEGSPLGTIVDQAKKITEHIMPEVFPLAIVTGDELVGLEGGAYGLAGDPLPEATGRCGYVIGVNDRLIANDVDLGCDELAHHSHAHFASTFLAVTLHEAIHHLIRNQPPACPARQDTKVREQLAQARSRPTDWRKEITSHDATFIRVALHVMYRVERLGLHLVFHVFDPANYNLGPTADWHTALGSEPWQRAHEPLRTIVQSPLPTALAKLWNERSGNAIAAARMAPQNSLRPMQVL